MTFLEAALQILGREGKALHFKELTEKAVQKKLLTFVGRTPEVTMQTQLTAAVKKAPGNPFVRVKPGVFGLLRYPEVAEPEAPPAVEASAPPPPAADAGESNLEGGRGRRPRRSRRGREPEPSVDAAAEAPEAEAESAPERAEAEYLGARAPQPESPTPLAASAGASPDEDDANADAGEEGDEEGEGELAAGGANDGEAGARRRRRRRRRRRGGGAEAGGLAVEAGSFAGDDMASVDPDVLTAATPDAVDGNEEAGGETSPAPQGAQPSASDDSQGRRIMAPIDAAIEVLRGQAPGRGVHVRQIADTAVRRRLVHGEAHEAWRVVRAALAAEPKERLRAGMRPRIRSAGSGLFALARRPADMDLEKAEFVYGEAVRAVRERTLASLEQRLGELASGAFEALARVILQREGFGPATFVKRVEGTVYLEALRGRGWKPSKCLVALRWGATPAGRRAVGELRAGVRARNADEGVLLLAGRLAEEAIREWKQPGPPIEVVDGPAMAEACARHGVGVINTQVSVDFVDADFFAELSEG